MQNEPAIQTMQTKVVKKKQKQTFPNAYQGRTLINLMLLTSSFLMWLLMVDLQDILVDMLGTNHSTKA